MVKLTINQLYILTALTGNIKMDAFEIHDLLASYSFSMTVGIYNTLYRLLRLKLVTSEIIFSKETHRNHMLYSLTPLGERTVEQYTNLLNHLKFNPSP